MPDLEARKRLLGKLLASHGNPLSLPEVSRVARATAGYSASDLTTLACDAAMGPVRDIPSARLLTVAVDEMRPIQLEDFRTGLAKMRSSVSEAEIKKYEEWNAKFGDVS